MPKRYVILSRRGWRSASGFGARYGIKAGIFALGVGVVVGTANRTNYLPKTSLVQRLVASAPAPASQTVAFDITHRAAALHVAPGGLDAGLEHERITYWVNRLSTTLSGGFEQSLQRMSKYADMITAKLDAKQAPRDLIYLAMIESDFNPTARSPMEAVGLWQFMSSTARRFGLTVGSKVDERKDPARATDAAIAYLSMLHDQFGSWYLAAAAYNSGEGTVQRALRKITGRTSGTDADFFRILPALPRETRDYVPKLIAAARVGSAPRAYGLSVDRAATAHED
jgi:membrane-bound lytic murein transglycosylase D